MSFQESAAHHGGDPLPQPPPPPKPETKVLSLLLKVVIMILLTTLFFVFLGLATALLLIHLCAASALHRRRRRRHGQSPNSSSGFSPRDLKKLLQFRFSTSVKPHCQTDCAICLDGFRKGQWCRGLSDCGHVYHRRCIDSWLVKVSACPLCRTCVRFDVEEHQVDQLRVFSGHVSSQNYEILCAL